MNTYETMSLTELIALRDSLQAEIAYCYSVDSPTDATATEAELAQVNEELNARRVLITTATTVRAGVSA